MFFKNMNVEDKKGCVGIKYMIKSEIYYKELEGIFKNDWL